MVFRPTFPKKPGGGSVSSPGRFGVGSAGYQFQHTPLFHSVSSESEQSWPRQRPPAAGLRMPVPHPANPTSASYPTGKNRQIQVWPYHDTSFLCTHPRAAQASAQRSVAEHCPVPCQSPARGNDRQHAPIALVDQRRKDKMHGVQIVHYELCPGGQISKGEFLSG